MGWGKTAVPRGMRFVHRMVSWNGHGRIASRSMGCVDATIVTQGGADFKCSLDRWCNRSEKQPKLGDPRAVGGGYALTSSVVGRGAWLTRDDGECTQRATAKLSF